MKHSAFTQGCSMESTDSNRAYDTSMAAVTIVDAYCIGAGARTVHSDSFARVLVPENCIANESNSNESDSGDKSLLLTAFVDGRLEAIKCGSDACCCRWSLRHDLGELWGAAAGHRCGRRTGRCAGRRL